jgi:hypothetical protein
MFQKKIAVHVVCLRFLLETTIMRILSFFWQTLFSVFAQQNVASLPKKLQFTPFFVFFEEKIKFLFIFLFARKKKDIFGNDWLF